MAGRVYNNTAYALGQSPLVGMAPSPIPAKRNPNTSDFAPIGQMWINTLTNTAYILTSVVNNSANWSASGGSSGSFTNLTVTGTLTLPGGITFTNTTPTIATLTGNLQTTGGIITTTINSTSITATGNISASGASSISTTGSGNIVAANGQVQALNNYIQGGSLVAVGDEGSISGGVTFTNVFNDTLGAGVATINTTTANATSNTGFIKVYVDSDAVFIPYFLNIAP